MRRVLLAGLLLVAPAAVALTPQAKEFMAVSKELEPVQCQKRQLRRQIMLAEAEQRGPDAQALKKKFSALNADAKTTRLEKRLGELERVIKSKGDPEDLSAISLQQREAFYRCE